MSTLHSYFDIQHTSSSPAKTVKIASPPATYQKGTANPPTAIELDDYTFGTRNNGPSKSNAQYPGGQPSGTPTPTEYEPPMPMSPNELEMSRPPSPKQDEAVAQVQSWNNPRMNIWRIASCCLIYFGNGINDSGMYHVNLDPKET